MSSVSASIEAKFLEAFRKMMPEIQSVGLLEVSGEGFAKFEGPTSVQVRVYNFTQMHEATGMFSVAAEIRLNVEQSESANGGLFAAAHEKIALWLERVMLGDECAALSTDEAHVDGFQRNGDDKDFDTLGGMWYAVWDLTLTGRIKKQEVANG